MLTKIWHPNIDLNGAICHNYLKWDASIHGENAGWKPTMHIQELVVGLLTILHYEVGGSHSDSFDANDPLNLDAAHEYRTNRSQFEQHAADWVQKHAKKYSF
eukprot:TRINITY_DN519_c0_g1_i4.p1 TRINITY_DN519_c0_g1~~TRINITY_DN519_c0_g1_i4.p1  ORF type:complete len:113 (-),score=23.93 TRINITY_DN519_c0_g1_i4:137-442(-)